MANYAVIENGLVINVIVAENLDIAKTVTGLDCVDITDTNAGIGWTYLNNKFEPPVLPVLKDILPKDIPK